MSLQFKYSLTFSAVLIGILFYLTVQLFESEKYDLELLSNQNFTSIFRSVNIIAEEALSVGTKDKIALKTIIKELFERKINGLEEILIVNRKQKFFVHYNNQNRELTDQSVPDTLWQNLSGATHLSDSIVTYTSGNTVFLIKKIVYRAAKKDIFLGYSQLQYSLTYITSLIEKKKNDTYSIAASSVLVSLLIISLVTAFLIRRIRQLRNATLEIASGNFLTLPVYGNDELSALTRSFNEMTTVMKERLLMSRYISDSTISLIQDESVESIQLGGDKEHLCVLFSDIRGFTSFSEMHEADQVVTYLNKILDLQVKIIKDHEGDIDKFIGDAVMAVFRGINKETNAVNAAIQIQYELKKLIHADELFDELHIGIGISSGEAVTGNIGSHNRMDFTAIGDTVNIASRICGLASMDEIIISESVKQDVVVAGFSLSRSFTRKLKNKLESLKLYKVNYE